MKNLLRCTPLLLLLFLGACRQEPKKETLILKPISDNTSLDSLLATADRADSIAIAGTVQDKAVAAIYRGHVYGRAGRFRLEQKVVKAALQNLTGKEDSLVYRSLYSLLGNAAKEMGEFPEALQMFNQALHYASGDTIALIGIYASIGQIFQMKFDLEQATKHLRYALAFAGTTKRGYAYLIALHTLANVYGMGGKIDSALIVDAQGLAIARTQGIRSSESSFLDNQAHCMVERGKLDSAQSLFLQSMAIDAALGNKKQVADTWLGLGMLATEKDNYVQAEEFLKSGLVQAQTVEYRSGIMTAWKYRSENFRAAGKLQESLDAYKEFSLQKDTLLSEKKNNAVAEWQAMYETEKKEEELRTQHLKIKQKNTVISLGSVSMAFLFSAVYFANRRTKLRKEKRYQEELFAHDQEASLKILIAEETERRRIAADLHDGVGQTLTAAWLNLQATQPLLEKLDPQNAKLLLTTTQLIGDCCSEVRQISHNMMPTALFQKGLRAALEEMLSRLNEDHLRVSFSADDYNPDTDKTVELVLYRIIQECVNNTVRHSKATSLFISLHQEDDQLAVLIEDNGVGMLQSEKGEGIGLQNIKSRVQYLRGSVEWNAVNEDGSGTIVEIYIPLSV